MGRHLTRDDRIGIEKLLKAGTSVCKIAEVIGCSERTIYREKIRVHCEVLDGRTYRMLPAYSAQIAQNRADALAEARKGRPLLLASAPGLAEYLETAIGKRRYSPDAAVQEIVLLDLPLPHLSAVTVYRYIYNGYLKLCSLDLPVGHYRPRRGKAVKYCSKKHSADKSISQRPAAAANRAEPGHWEMDTVVGAKGSRPCLLVLTERTTRFEIVKRMDSKTVRETVRCLREIRQGLGVHFDAVFKSITCDNGCEFDTAPLLEQFAPIYYCHPYSSWERGSNENQNKLVRRFVPKGKCLDRLTAADADRLTQWMNHYPRRLLGGRRPSDLFAEAFPQIFSA